MRRKLKDDIDYHSMGKRFKIIAAVFYSMPREQARRIWKSIGILFELDKP